MCDGVVFIDCWERMTDVHLAKYASMVRWMPPPRLVVDNDPVPEVLDERYAQTG
jgi:hypothetical protein